MYPEIDLGPITLQTFGLMFALSFVAAGVLGGWRMRELNLPVDWAYEAVLVALVGGLVGAKLWFIVESGDASIGDFFSGFGLVFYGGAFGGAIAVALWARWRGILDGRILTISAPGLAAAYAIGRIGCQLSGDGDYGTESDLPWAMGYPDGTVPTLPGVTVHPTPVYETLFMGAFAVLLWRLRDRVRPGALFGLYLVVSGIERFLIEFIRLNDEVLAGLTLAQVVSIAFVAGGVGMIARGGWSPKSQS